MTIRGGMSSEERTAEMRRLRDEIRRLSDQFVQLYQEQVGEVPPRVRKPRPRPNYLTVVKTFLGGGIAALGLRKLLAGVTVTGAATAAMVTGIILVPSVTHIITQPPPAAGIVAPAPHAKRRLRQVPPPVAAPVTTPVGAGPQSQASPPVTPLPSVSASVTPGGTSTVQVTTPAPLPTVSTCIPLPLLGKLCLAA